MGDLTLPPLKGVGFYSSTWTALMRESYIHSLCVRGPKPPGSGVPHPTLSGKPVSRLSQQANGLPSLVIARACPLFLQCFTSERFFLGQRPTSSFQRATSFEVGSVYQKPGQHTRSHAFIPPINGVGFRLGFYNQRQGARIMDGSHIKGFFLEPRQTFQRQYEALRAIFVDNEPLERVAERFGYRRN